MSGSSSGKEASSVLSGRIRQLPEALIDQIAAGEVVERPASVVKELVENALDAGASRITVEVREGGAAFLAVTDDGQGMSPGDARMALRRHATSKVSSAEDLERVSSFGFRGEALPAIASVSRLRLRTRPPGAGEAWEIRVEGGRIVDERAAGAPEGTRVEVADLFGSVPARRKFLKRPATEWGHIADWLSRLALALPLVHFEIRRDDRPAVVWPATAEVGDRAAALLGEAVASVLVPVEVEGPEAHVQALLSGPEHARSNGGGLYLFVNGRPVRDSLLRHAILDAYRDVLPRGRFPTAILFVTVPAESVDVNVHPAKWEVRFADPRAIHRAVRRCVRDAMSERRWLDAAASATQSPGVAWRYGAAPERSPGAGGDRVRERGPSAETSDWIFAGRRPEGDVAGHDPGGPSTASPFCFRDLRLVGQLLASYLVVEGKQGLLLIDQHAAHERVLYERLREEWLSQGVARQPLLMSETVTLEPLALAALLAGSERASRLGFDLERFGEDAVMVRSIPALLAGRDPAALARGLARELEDPDTAAAGGEGGASDTRLLQEADRSLATLACHSARRFGDHLEPAEQRAILHALDDIPWAPTCPHGRPVAASFDLTEIERRFGRR